MRSLLRNGLDWAGMAIGAAAWAINQQANYALVGAACSHARILVPSLALLLAIVALFGSALSFRAWRVLGADTGPWLEAHGRPHAFRALLSACIGILFAAVILMQGVASLILTGCER